MNGAARPAPSATPASDTANGVAPARIALAALWMTGAIVAFSSMAVAGRAISTSLDTFEILTFRSLVGIVLVLGISTLTGTRRQIRARRLPLHGLRNLSHFVGQNLWFYAIFTIPLAQVFALEFTQPIWVALAAPLVLGERLTAARLGAALVGFAGVVIVAQPQAGGIHPGQAAAALAALGFAGSALTTKLLTRTETITSILFWLTLMQAAMGLICAGWDGDIALPTVATAPWLAVIAVGGLGAHFCLTTALSLAPAGIVIPMDFLRLPVIAAIGALVYGEALSPDVALGAVLILGANALNLRTARPRPESHA